MKTLAVISCLDRVNKSVTPDQIEEISKKGIHALNEWIFVAPEIICHRGDGTKGTMDCGSAMYRYIINKTDAVISSLPANNLFNIDPILSQIPDTALFVSAPKKVGLFQVLTDFHQNLLTEIQRNLMEATIDLFRRMRKDEMAIIFGRPPMVELLAFFFDPSEEIDRKLNLKRMTGFLLQEEDGKISIMRKLGF